MRSTNERAQLKSLIQSPQWGALQALASELSNKLLTEVTTDTEWETLSTTLLSRGGVKTINRLFQEVEKEALYDGNESS